ncbi:MAG: hypothetical protein NHB15_08195 [Methanosarcina barkeri]|nr:hypothetical protein [Methanosarcina sp. ERenArc_MAG2]
MADEFIFEPIWAKGISFKVFKMEKKLDYIEFLKNLKKYQGDLEKRKDGWLVDDPYFSSENNNFNAFLYRSFIKNKKASELEGKDILVPDYVGLTFDFEEQLIIASTMSNNKINTLFETALKPITDLCEISVYSYSGDFLFWLIYMNDKKQGRINEEIVIRNITMVSSDRNKQNLLEAISNIENVTNESDGKIILGQNQSVNVVRMQLYFNGNLYGIVLYSDGRIKAMKGSKPMNKKEKAIYAKSIHKIIEDMYAEYKKDNQWGSIKEGYSNSLIKKGIEDLARHNYRPSSKITKCIFSKYHIPVINQNF